MKKLFFCVKVRRFVVFGETSELSSYDRRKRSKVGERQSLETIWSARSSVVKRMRLIAAGRELPVRSGTTICTESCKRKVKGVGNNSDL